MHRYYYFMTIAYLNVNVNLELRQSHAQLHMHHRLTRYIIIATIYKPRHTVKQVAELSQRDRATHDLSRFAKLRSGIFEPPFGGLGET